MPSSALSAKRSRATTAYQLGHGNNFRGEAHRIAASVLQFTPEQFENDIANTAGAPTLQSEDGSSRASTPKGHVPKRTLAAEMSRLGLQADTIRLVRKHINEPLKRRLTRERIHAEVQEKLDGLWVE